MKNKLAPLLCLAITVGFSSCASYQTSTKEFRNSWDLGDEVSALSNLEQAGQSIQTGHDEELLWNLEMITTSRANKANELTDLHIDRAKSIADKKTLEEA